MATAAAQPASAPSSNNSSQASTSSSSSSSNNHAQFYGGMYNQGSQGGSSNNGSAVKKNYFYLSDLSNKPVQIKMFVMQHSGGSRGLNRQRSHSRSHEVNGGGSAMLTMGSRCWLGCPVRPVQ